ncbi:hypothetical protein SNE40_001623 [Patella caerulea]|uniref:Uncharacterized protein n=1 Tax=Patella caerulea TaxID=87958 RepID=A0AAN8KCW8_PATCE
MTSALHAPGASQTTGPVQEPDISQTVGASQAPGFAQTFGASQMPGASLTPSAVQILDVLKNLLINIKLPEIPHRRQVRLVFHHQRTLPHTMWRHQFMSQRMRAANQITRQPTLKRPILNQVSCHREIQLLGFTVPYLILHHSLCDQIHHPVESNVSRKSTPAVTVGRSVPPDGTVKQVSSFLNSAFKKLNWKGRLFNKPVIKESLYPIHGLDFSIDALKVDSNMECLTSRRSFPGAKIEDGIVSCWESCVKQSMMASSHLGTHLEALLEKFCHSKNEDDICVTSAIASAASALNTIANINNNTFLVGNIIKERRVAALEGSKLELHLRESLL